MQVAQWVMIEKVFETFPSEKSSYMACDIIAYCDWPTFYQLCNDIACHIRSFFRWRLQTTVHCRHDSLLCPCSGNFVYDTNLVTVPYQNTLINSCSLSKSRLTYLAHHLWLFFLTSPSVCPVFALTKYFIMDPFQ